MQVATGAMGSLLPKLGELLMEEYNLQKSAKKGVESLLQEMKSMHAALRKVAEVPRDELDEQIMLWAGEVRDLSYNIEDVVDKFLIRVKDPNKPAADGKKLTDLVEKMGNLFNKGKARRQIASAIKVILEDVKDVANRHDRYTVDNIAPKPTMRTTINPRLRALYTEVTELVGIYGKRDQELLKLLSLGGEDPSKKKLKIVSVVGFGGLGKTTLVRAVYDKIKGDFGSLAFVPVGRNPDVKKVFRDILIGLNKKKYTNINLMVLDERQLIEELREFLEDKRPATQVVFEQGALPTTEAVRFNLGVRVAREDGNGERFELGLGNLLSLQSALIKMFWKGVTVKEAKKAEAAVRNALNGHPNHPRLFLIVVPDIPEACQSPN